MLRATEIPQVFGEQFATADVVVEPLMDPTLWGEMPRFPRYLVAGSRLFVKAPGPQTA